MEEVKEQRYMCKICGKNCVSGKSLGGHMRVHLPLISSSKKAAQAKAEIEMDSEIGNDPSGAFQLKNKSICLVLTEEKIQNCDSSMDFGDGDQYNSYELRENPKKSWRISDSKHSVSGKATCKECHKGFPSSRALSGHMRCHSVKNKDLNQCKICGKAFDSMRAMFGHMKSHSKKSRFRDESADSSLDLEIPCPVQKKRSRFRYKITRSPSFSSLNASASAVSEFEEVEEAAMCLMMLSKGMKDWNQFTSVTESSAGSSCKSGEVAGNDGSFIRDCVEMSTGLSIRKLFANAISEKNVSESDDFDSTKAPKLLNEAEVKLDCTDEQRCSSLPATMAESVEDLMVAAGIQETDSEILKSLCCKKARACVQDLGAKKNTSENPSCNLNVLNDVEKKHEYKRRIRDKIFHSHQELGGYNARQKTLSSISMDTNIGQLSVTEDGSKNDYPFKHNANQLKQENTGFSIDSLELSKSKEYQCPICFKFFTSGQALGGHKRVHFSVFTGIKTKGIAAANQGLAEIRDFLDLNFPSTADESSTGDVGLNLWLVEKGHEHEALLLTN